MTGSLSAAEDCPVSKISLARGLACEAYRLAKQATVDDSKIDAICLKLGRTSAIFRRTQGQLPSRPTAPIPPTSWKQRAIEIEGFCGVGADKNLPRGLVNIDYVMAETEGFQDYLKARVQENSKWISENTDPEAIGCPAPTPLSEEDAAACI